MALDAIRKFGERDVDGAELAEICDCGLASTGVFKKIVGHLKTPEINFPLDDSTAGRPIARTTGTGSIPS